MLQLVPYNIGVVSSNSMSLRLRSYIFGTLELLARIAPLTFGKCICVARFCCVKETALPPALLSLGKVLAVSICNALLVFGFGPQLLRA